MKRNSYNMGKYLLRHAFEGGNYLPEGILWREKAAFSDAVGHSLVDDLKEYAGSLYSDAEFEEKCGKYDFARPFTKESLLYRDIFEKYYPGQATMQMTPPQTTLRDIVILTSTRKAESTRMTTRLMSSGENDENIVGMIES